MPLAAGCCYGARVRIPFLQEDLGAEWFERVLGSVEATRNTQREDITRLWHSRAVTVDSFSRLLLPLVYYTTCAVLYGSRLPPPAPTSLVSADGAS